MHFLGFLDISVRPLALDTTPLSDLAAPLCVYS